MDRAVSRVVPTERAACTKSNHVLCWRRGGGGRPQGEGSGPSDGSARGDGRCAHRAARRLARAAGRRQRRHRRPGPAAGPAGGARHGGRHTRAGSLSDRRRRGPARKRSRSGCGTTRSAGVGRSPSPVHISRQRRAGLARSRSTRLRSTSWAAAVREVGPVLEVTRCNRSRRRNGRVFRSVTRSSRSTTSLPTIHTLDGNLALGTTSQATRLSRRPRARPRPQARAAVASSIRGRRDIQAAHHHRTRAGVVRGEGHRRLGGTRARPRVHRHAHCGRPDWSSADCRDRRARSGWERRSGARLRREGDRLVEGRCRRLHDAPCRRRRCAALRTTKRPCRSASRRWTRRCNGSASTAARALRAICETRESVRLRSSLCVTRAQTFS